MILEEKEQVWSIMNEQILKHGFSEYGLFMDGLERVSTRFQFYIPRVYTGSSIRTTHSLCVKRGLFTTSAILCGQMNDLKDINKYFELSAIKDEGYVCRVTPRSIQINPGDTELLDVMGYVTDDFASWKQFFASLGATESEIESWVPSIAKDLPGFQHCVAASVKRVGFMPMELFDGLYMASTGNAGAYTEEASREVYNYLSPLTIVSLCNEYDIRNAMRNGREIKKPLVTEVEFEAYDEESVKSVTQFIYVMTSGMKFEQFLNDIEIRDNRVRQRMIML